MESSPFERIGWNDRRACRLTGSSMTGGREDSIYRDLVYRDSIYQDLASRSDLSVIRQKRHIFQSSIQSFIETTLKYSRSCKELLRFVQ
jgi:hypothetical protein